ADAHVPLDHDTPGRLPGPGGGFLHRPAGASAVGGLGRRHWLGSFPPRQGTGRLVRGMNFGVLWGTGFTSAGGGAAGPRRRHLAMFVGSGRPLLAPVPSAASVRRPRRPENGTARDRLVATAMVVSRDGGQG